jgi:aspartyl-tRNA(Asn)/glutamyl-tRNA(Gln) amidotransferase subunit A
MASSKLLNLGITEALRKIYTRELSPVELVRSYLERIDELNASLNVYLTVTAEEALATAAAAEKAVIRGDALGILHGLPVALKDNCEVAGVRMTAGSKFLRDHVAAKDSEVASRLRRAGAIILGKLCMHEWAIGGTTRNPYYGPGRNPWDPTRIPGGSSGGSGAALAADLALATLGTDTGGSVRIPAALNGVCGLRPTSGRISNQGVVPVSWTFDTVGPMARRAEDVAHLLQALAGYDPNDPTSVDVEVKDYLSGIHAGVKGLRVGLLGGHFLKEPRPEVSKMVLKAARVYEDLGAAVEELELPGAEATIERTSEMLLSEAAAFHQARLEQSPDDFGQDVLARLRIGAGITGIEYALAREEQRRWQRQLEEIFGRYQVLLAPTCGIPAPLIEESEGVETTRLLTRFTYPFSLAQVPVMSIPCGFTENNLPVGMQLVGRHWQEALLLRVAWAYQQTTDWHLRRPVLKNS